MEEEDEFGKGVLGKSWRNLAVNLPLIWKITKNEDKFIEKFAEIYTHEFLHNLIKDIVSDINKCGEERAVRVLLDAEWSKDLSKYYACDIYEELI
ncbi:MAG: hypothetical protein HYS32_00105 [Candidatus Woesearchaeota archaeon]|nr:MAG: hypothetical protein HYS32_00105 [Candidatus Woesearchaeota archaeon]